MPGTKAMKSQTQRSLLLAAIGSIVCCGLVGVYCLLVGRMGVSEGRILATTAVVGAASILGLASAIPWERRRWQPIGPLGLAGVAIALVLVLVAIWFDPPWSRWEVFYRITGIGCVAGVALPLVGLLGLGRLKRQYGWVRRVTIMLITILGVQLSYMMIAEADDDFWWRMTGILAIGVVCGTTAVPILHRVSAIRAREEIRTVELFVSLTCPRCRKTQELPAGRSKCTACGLKFSIDIEEEHCKTCGYPLYRLTSAVCPECGTPLTQDVTT